MAVVHSAPKYASNDGVLDALRSALGDMFVEGKESHGEISITVERESVADALRHLRDEHAYQMLVEIAGVDYPDRPERFEVCYHLLSLTKNHRVRIKVTTDEDHPVPTATVVWPNANWLEREVFDMYGVLFSGPSGPTPHSHRLRLSRTPVSQGLSADRLCRNALFRGAAAGDL